MNYIVLDLEWNQPFTIKQMKRHPFPLIGEVIQIGAVKLDENFEVVDNFKIPVCPKYYTRLHKHVEEITGLGQREISFGLSFKAASEYWYGNTFSYKNYRF